MKNKKLLKTLLLILMVVVAFTWVIPSTTINQTSQQLELGTTMPEGLLGVFGSYDIISSYFFQNILIVLFVGMFYGVMNKTGAYKDLVKNVASSFKKKKEVLLILSIVFFILMPALTNIYFLMFLFVPFFMSVLKELGYNKNIMLLSTVGSILIGLSTQIASKTFAGVTGSIDNPYIWIKVGLLVLSVITTVVYALIVSSGKEENKEDSMLELESKVEKKKGKTNVVNPNKLNVILIVMFVFFLLGFIPWEYKFLQTIHTSVMGVEIFNYPIFAKLFGNFQPFGSWWSSEFYTMLTFFAVLITFIYKLSFDDFVDGVVEGLKKFFVPAFLVGLMTLITIFTLNSGYLGTILKFIVSSGNAALVALGTIVGAPLVADNAYIANYSVPIIIQAIAKPNAEQIAFITQITYGATMLLVPTSAIMVAGLAYLEKDYKSWFKYIWKLALILLILVFIAVIISTLI